MKGEGGGGFAQDPDADRLAIIDENGTYIGEEYSLALCTNGSDVVKPVPVRRRIFPRVGWWMTLRRRLGRRVYARRWGRRMCGEGDVKDRGPSHWRGGEWRGDRSANRARCAISCWGWRCAALMTRTGKTISQLVAEIPRYAMVKTKFECRRADAERGGGGERRIRESEDRHEDGMRIDWADGWVHVRPSNTEPIMRMIAEAPDRAEAEKYISQVRAVVDHVLK